ncbi:MAG TPA: hypothetical protein VJX10_09630 [Pseudonocardiaceae bacterium]|nr:hypothetical protein [Pseudonocardiaceae bacterium]
MRTAADHHVAWSDLVRHSGLESQDWHVVGVFQAASATYNVTFRAEPELARFLDYLFTSGESFGTSRLYRRAAIYPLRPEYDLSGLRFQFDAEHQVAAAALLADDHDADHLYRWITRGDAGRDDVVLAHDSWNEHETAFPSSAFITVSQLREVVTQWAFGEVLPPPVVGWVDGPDDLGWL